MAGPYPPGRPRSGSAAREARPDHPFPGLAFRELGHWYGRQTFGGHRRASSACAHPAYPHRGGRPRESEVAAMPVPGVRSAFTTALALLLLALAAATAHGRVQAVHADGVAGHGGRRHPAVVHGAPRRAGGASQQLGSADVTAPAGFTVVSASVPAPGTATVPGGPCGCATSPCSPAARSTRPRRASALHARARRAGRCSPSRPTTSTARPATTSTSSPARAR